MSYKSRFETKFAKALDKLGVGYKYELKAFDYPLPIYSANCGECGSGKVIATRSYTPDWFLDNGLIIETKGRMTARDRRAIKHIRHVLGEDIRFIFLADNKLSRTSKTRYSDWCKANEIPCAFKEIPHEWTQG